MREILFVKKLDFNFPGAITKNALVIGDADNDKHNELVCANLQGTLAVFKGRCSDRYAYATNLGMVTACVVGDIINVNKNYIAAINTEGWLFIFHLDDQRHDTPTTTTSTLVSKLDDTRLSDDSTCSQSPTPTTVPSPSSPPLPPPSSSSSTSRKQSSPPTPPPPHRISTKTSPSSPPTPPSQPLDARTLDPPLENSQTPSETTSLPLSEKLQTSSAETSVPSSELPQQSQQEEQSDNGTTTSSVKQHDTTIVDKAIKLSSIYQQRMPANCKELLLADLDGDGQNEVIIGLTDRVLRTYKWVKIPNSTRGKFVGLYKWEFADQIGSVSLNPSKHGNCLDIIVAQPGGTYAKLDIYEKKLSPTENKSKTKKFEISGDIFPDFDSIKTEYINKLTPEYHQLALIQMRNHHISTEVLGGIRNGKNSDSYNHIVVATLDGTLMLVNKDEILWSLQVDHQLFTLKSLEHIKPKCKNTLTQSESTCTIVPNPSLLDEKKNNNASQYVVACAWNGKTYIIDEERNYLRFKFEEAVSSFTAGNFFFDGMHHPSLVYATFSNKITLYYDVIIDHVKPIYVLSEVTENLNELELLGDLKKLCTKLKLPNSESPDTVRKTLRDIIYSIYD